ncbi:MAG: response regulator transcription factor [Solirubrobacterales bacterium]
MVRDETEPIRILVVEDELNIAELLAMALRYEGFEVKLVAGGQDALAQVESFRPRLLILDVMLPDLDGFELARRITAGGSGIPIVFLTARDTTEDKIRGLTLGGDDYMTKPFSVEELVARVRTVLRRTDAAPSSERLVFEDLELNEDSREVYRAGNLVELTATEFRLLRYLLLNPGRVLSRNQILDHVWDYDFGGNGRVLETYISYLRKKVDRASDPLIHTVRGVGYVMRAPRS